MKRYKSYFKETSKIKENIINVPTKWGMYTSKGNNAITKIAKKLISSGKISVGWNGKKQIEIKQSNVIDFLEAYADLAKKEGYKEAFDTEVRQKVYAFVKMIVQEAMPHLNREDMDDVAERLWDDHSF